MIQPTPLAELPAKTKRLRLQQICPRALKEGNLRAAVWSKQEAAASRASSATGGVVVHDFEILRLSHFLQGDRYSIPAKML
jgi:hypothetical protein